ncbi:uncharacterized protein LOC113207436 [Frankliniella occidentalis]|uniref:Uncharacterized protein LOC113207436 n=1 Tax=Frankliniella occidentalis TaxID=133901 RepID=A0A9C6XQF3_FRAOC|nr:uncharacterized protein LOC113207436 [Frankliniella occidentalis]
MGVSVEAWRMRIGGFNCSGSIGIVQIISLPMSYALSSLHIFLLLFVLLLIGNIELNPGPIQLNPCAICNFKAISAEQHIQHQRIHESVFNFQFSCPFLGCPISYSSLRSLNAHLSKHTQPRNEVTSGTVIFKCEFCEINVASNRDYCLHIKDKHLNVENSEGILCPLFLGSEGKCRTVLYTVQAFALHLSRCHPGWRDDYSTSALTSCQQQPLMEAEMNIPTEPLQHMDMDTFDDSEQRDEFGSVHNPVDKDSDDSSSTSSFESEHGGGFHYDQIEQYIGHFYVMLEGKYIVPSSTIDALASKLSFITEIVQDKFREKLSQALTNVGLGADVISDIVRSVVSMDPLYNSHHKKAPGACFLTKDLRLSYYKKHFKYQEPIQINLRRDPKNTDDTIQYVDVKQSLNLLLEDPSVQKVVDKSFEVPPSDGSVISNYTDGSVYRESQTPPKRIDLLLYMDGYNCASPLGSAKNKHKTHGMYMTLGNLDPFMRAFLRAMRLVLVVNENSLKETESRFQKCFERLIKDLKDLERDGIIYRGENVPVRVQFIQGDNLGQNCLGGFVESFSALFYCRFCDLSKADFKNGCNQDVPTFPLGNWRTPDSFRSDLRDKLRTENDHERGVKRDSPFNQLDNFHVCDPRLAPCIGHDLFITGVVDTDLTSMIKGMIKKNWFTSHLLNMRIRGFKYEGTDARNKPAPFNEEKDKLGGHAVQNWTLFRLLPLLIGDLVRTDDDLWKLYLLLKRTVELICAPSLTAAQLELMKRRIEKYMRRRKILPNKYKPKHHFFSHYYDLYLKFGPLVHMWSMAFEHRHQFFKRVSQICRNFINLNKLLAKKFQLLMAYQSMGHLFPDKPVFSKTSPLENGSYDQALSDFLLTLNLPEESTVVENMVLNDISHKPDEFLFLSGANYDIILGKVKIIIFDGNVCKVVVERKQTEWWEEYGIFYVTEDSGYAVIRFEELENPCPLPLYNFKGKLCFSLKHDLRD